MVERTILNLYVGVYLYHVYFILFYFLCTYCIICCMFYGPVSDNKALLLLLLFIPGQWFSLNEANCMCVSNADNCCCLGGCTDPHRQR